jgi:hypothetical protein
MLPIGVQGFASHQKAHGTYVPAAAPTPAPVAIASGDRPYAGMRIVARMNSAVTGVVESIQDGTIKVVTSDGRVDHLRPRGFSMQFQAA